MGGSDFKILCLKTVKIKRRSVNPFPFSVERSFIIAKLKHREREEFKEACGSFF